MISLKKMLSIVAVAQIVLLIAAGAQASTYTFHTDDLNELAHGYDYEWGISAEQLGKELGAGYKITSAKLEYTNIWNWTYNEAGNKLSTYLLSNAVPTPSAVPIPLYVNGVEQGHTVYTYTKTVYTFTETIYSYYQKVYTYTYNHTFSTRQPQLASNGYTETTSFQNGKIVYTYKKTIQSTDATAPAGFTKTSTQTLTKKVYNDATPPEGYTFQSIQTYTKTSTNPTPPANYVLTNTQVMTKTGTSPTAPSGYVVTGSTFAPQMITLPAGTPLGSNVWYRYAANGSDPYWGPDITATLIGEWHDSAGGKAGNFNLVYNFDSTLISILFEDALDGSFGFGLDPMCHYYDSGVTFTVTTSPVPEPATMLLFGLGLVGLTGLRRRMK